MGEQIPPASAALGVGMTRPACATLDVGMTRVVGARSRRKG